CQQYTDSPFSF
nr:immunoglobulin light chain junction region [Macaca mulatta]